MKHTGLSGLPTARLLGLWDRARTSFWLVPASMTLAAAVLSYATVAFDRRLGPEAMGALGWVWSGGASGARSVLSTVAGSMATVAGVVFSVNIVALTLASSQFGPRLLRNFTRDLGNQIVLGTFIATFLYSLLVLRTVRGADEGGFVPELSVTCAVLLAVASVGVLIYFIGHVAEAIQAESLIAAVGQELKGEITRRHGPGPARGPHAPEPSESGPPGGTPLAVHAASGGYVQGIAHDDLAAVAANLDAVVRVLCRPGDFVLTGEALALVHGAGRLPDEDAARIRRAFALGPRRTPAQDVRYTAQRLTEIAVRALSPAINDPATAMGCVDWLGEAMAELARCTPEPAGHHRDGRLRVLARPVGFAELAESAFTPIRTYGAGDPAVAVHLIHTLTRAGRDGGGADRAALLRLTEQTAEGATRQAADEADRARIADALARARAALGPRPPAPGARLSVSRPNAAPPRAASPG